MPLHHKQTSKANILALPKTPRACSSVLFTHSLAGKEQQHPLPASKRMKGPRFEHVQGILKHYKGAEGSPRSPSSSASPGSCALLNSCHVPPQNFLQLSKKNKRNPSTKIDKYPKILEETDRHPLVNSCALLWHRPSLEDTALEEAMIIIIKCLDGSQASGFQHLADEINKGAFGKHGGNKHDTIRETGGIPASLIASFPFASSGTSCRRVLQRIRPLTSPLAHSLGMQIPSLTGVSPPGVGRETTIRIKG